MPVLDLGMDVNHIAGVQFLRFLSPRLVPAMSLGAEQNLSAFMVDMPVVAATRLKGHVGNRAALVGQRLQ